MRARANFKNTKRGDKVILIHEEPFYHWFKDRVNNARKLDKTKAYTVYEIDVASSSTTITLFETGDLKYELCWFEKV